MFGSSSSYSSSNDDPVVGLDVGGKLFYFTLSKLTKSESTYFAKHLKRNGSLEDNVAYTDDRGRKVVFVDRSPTYFEYVRDFIVSDGVLHLPANDLALRRNIRDEATFYGLETLTEALQVTQEFSPAKSNRGLFYWLGTDRGTKEEYENPFQMGMINITGWMDDEDNEEEDMYDLARFARSRETFVHYQLKPEVVAAGKRGNDWDIEQFSCLQWCGHAHKRMPVVVDLKSVQFQPTHYSLRVSECKGMAGDWNFEASNDGKEWEVLHEARDDDNLWLEEGSEEIKAQLTKTLAFYNDHVQDDELSGEILLTILEQDYRCVGWIFWGLGKETCLTIPQTSERQSLHRTHDQDSLIETFVSFCALTTLSSNYCIRHTWKLEPPPKKFYTQFRLIGASKLSKKNKEKDADEDEGGCLHGEGLELFGNLYEN